MAAGSASFAAARALDSPAGPISAFTGSTGQGVSLDDPPQPTVGRARAASAASARATQSEGSAEAGP